MRADRKRGCVVEHPQVPQGSIPYFDSIAGGYFAKYAEDSPGGYAFRERQTRVRELLADAAGRVLDIGCGPGVMVQDVLHLGCDFWGLDGSPQMIAQCRKRFGRLPRAHFSVGNAVTLPFADETFDLVMCIGVIDRVPQPEVAIAEMARVLRPIGTLLISFPNILSPYALWRSHVFYLTVGYLKRLMVATSGRPPQPDLCSAATLWTLGAASRTVCRLVGEVKQIAYYNFGLLLSPLDELFPTQALWLARRLESLWRSRLRWLGAGFLLKVQKRA